MVTYKIDGKEVSRKEFVKRTATTGSGYASLSEEGKKRFEAAPDKKSYAGKVEQAKVKPSQSVRDDSSTVRNKEYVYLEVEPTGSVRRAVYERTPEGYRQTGQQVSEEVAERVEAGKVSIVPNYYEDATYSQRRTAEKSFRENPNLVKQTFQAESGGSFDVYRRDVETQRKAFGGVSVRGGTIKKTLGVRADEQFFRLRRTQTQQELNPTLGGAFKATYQGSAGSVFGVGQGVVNFGRYVKENPVESALTAAALLSPIPGDEAALLPSAIRAARSGYITYQTGRYGFSSAKRIRESPTPGQTGLEIIGETGASIGAYRFLSKATEPKILKRVILTQASWTTGLVGGRPAKVRSGRKSKVQIRKEQAGTYYNPNVKNVKVDYKGELYRGQQVRKPGRKVTAAQSGDKALYIREVSQRTGQANVYGRNFVLANRGKTISKVESLRVIGTRNNQFLGATVNRQAVIKSPQVKVRKASSQNLPKTPKYKDPYAIIRQFGSGSSKSPRKGEISKVLSGRQVARQKSSVKQASDDVAKITILKNQRVSVKESSFVDRRTVPAKASTVYKDLRPKFEKGYVPDSGSQVRPGWRQGQYEKVLARIEANKPIVPTSVKRVGRFRSESRSSVPLIYQGSDRGRVEITRQPLLEKPLVIQTENSLGLLSDGVGVSSREQVMVSQSIAQIPSQNQAGSQSQSQRRRSSFQLVFPPKTPSGLKSDVVPPRPNVRTPTFTSGRSTPTPPPYVPLLNPPGINPPYTPTTGKPPKPPFGFPDLPEPSKPKSDPFPSLSFKDVSRYTPSLEAAVFDIKDGGDEDLFKSGLVLRPLRRL